MIDENYMNVCSEVLAILDKLKIEDYEKIPKSLIEGFEKNKNPDYTFEYDYSKRLVDQKTDDLTKGIISNLFRDYIASGEEREAINKEEQIKKVDLHNSSIIFKDEILLNDNRINYLKELGEKNKFIQKAVLRPIAWKLYLRIIPEDKKSIEEWINITDLQRKEYKKKLEKLVPMKSIKNYKSIDPLLVSENKDNDEKEASLINLINLDLERTHQSIELFQEEKTKKILFNILFIYSKENEDIPYRQGMNELISMFFMLCNC